MILLNGIMQYENCLAPLYAKSDAIQTNCPFLLNETRDLIENKALFYSEQQDIVVLLQDCGLFYELYYYSDFILQPELPSLPKDKPILLNFTYLKKTAEMETVQAYWTARGFTAYKTARRMARKIEPVAAEVFPERYQYLSEQYVAQVYEKLMQWFDPISDALPSLNELLNAVKEKRLFGALDTDGTVLAFQYFSIEKRSLTLLHVGVEPSARSKGIGKKMLACLFQIAATHHVPCVYAWVNEGNTSSIKMHQSAGFIYDRGTVEKYILKNTEDK